MTQLQMASWNASVSVWQRNGGNSARTGGSLANCANARICKRLWLTLDGDQAGEKNYTFALPSMSNCYVNFNGTRDDICLGTGCLISFPGRGGLPTWCNYDTALRGVGRVGLALFVLPLVDDLVCIASEK